MEKREESQSNWSCVTQLLENNSPLKLGRYTGYWFHHTPRRMLHSLSYYKFAAKMIGSGKRVLDVGCNEGLGSYLLSKECGQCDGIDFDQGAVELAQENYPELSFSCEDFLQSDKGPYDALVNFDVIEHIYPENAGAFLGKIADHLSDYGVALIGTPSEISQTFASDVSKRGHVNIYSAERLEKEVKEHFEHCFLFAANDEIVHTGYLPLAHYLIALACRPKR